ncbi:FecR family protein [Pseudomonas sp. SZMC_28357]|uniref:FecR family protein n=1 Tax=Pseudomonas sp. SZMC_28357 TaxID=3074380 RepID=UPI00287150E5|nr:FecR family protein [Pseudomonas sp. SZMC_28357]MDR9753641.1 FecR family protein [Pseudomonas sp. SZMC_28357]
MTEHTYSEAEYDAITDAAAHWCMRLHAEDCTEAERQAFELWRDADPLHAFEYDAMLDIWDVAEHLPRSAIAPDPAPTPVAIMPVKPTTSWRTWGMAAAITVLALPVAAYSGWNLGWLPNAYQHVQAQDSVRLVTLEDGTQVQLNLGTDLTYLNFKDQRRVILKKGEAFFTVSHDTRHPFIVKAAKGQVRVTGTRFNVWMYDDQVRVNLVEGSVLVTSNDTLPGDGLRLTAGMQAGYRDGDFSPQISQTYATDNALAWLSGKLVLDNLPLSEALPLINRYLANPVMIADQGTGRLRIGGIYNINEMKRLVPSLPKVLPVYLTQNKDGNPVLNALPQQPPKS